jgi:H+-translocating NAD(P) transhydrogenase subunit alpha
MVRHQPLASVGSLPQQETLVLEDMQIGILRCATDPLVAVVPDVGKKLIHQGYSLVLESGAGAASLFDDEAYTAIGAKVADREEVLQSSDILVTVSKLLPADLEKAKSQTILIGQFNVRVQPQWADQLTQSSLRVFSLDKLPRTSVAQSMDVLSALSSLAGYKAVVSAAERFPAYFPMMTTAAGTIPPAKVLILGAGVAGLQAIATARRLGAVVEAFDVRSAVKEEVQSLGASFVEVEGSSEDAEAGGYAVVQSDAYQQKQKELIHDRALRADVVICTAQIPGREAPKLLEARTVQQMKPGSVIIDMAASTGGNCELTQNDKEITINNVTIVGNSKLHNRLPMAASRLFANNLFNFIKFMMKDDEPRFDHEIVSATFLGELSTATDQAS